MKSNKNIISYSNNQVKNISTNYKICLLLFAIICLALPAISQPVNSNIINATGGDSKETYKKLNFGVNGSSKGYIGLDNVPNFLGDGDDFSFRTTGNRDLNFSAGQGKINFYPSVSRGYEVQILNSGSINMRGTLSAPDVLVYEDLTTKNIRAHSYNAATEGFRLTLRTLQDDFGFLGVNKTSSIFGDGDDFYISSKANFDINIAPGTGGAINLFPDGSDQKIKFTNDGHARLNILHLIDASRKNEMLLAHGGQYAYMANVGNGGIDFRIGSADLVSSKMRLTSSGRLGIGNLDPAYTLDVAGSGRLEVLRIKDAGSGDEMLIGHGGLNAYMANLGTGNLDFRIGSASINDSKMRLTSDGKLGIGTTTPQVTLDVVGDGSMNNLQVSDIISSDNIFIKNKGGQEVNVRQKLEQLDNDISSIGDISISDLYQVDDDGNDFLISHLADDVNYLQIDHSAKKLYLGTSSTNGSSAIVRGDLCVSTDLSSCPDYVFTDSYELRSIGELSNYINANGHLPGVISAKELVEKGEMDMVKFNFSLLEKIEELALYTIDQEERIENQSNSISQKNKEIKTLENRLDELEILVKQMINKD